MDKHWKSWSPRAFVWGLIVAFVCLAILLFMSTPSMLSSMPGLAYLFARLTYVGLFMAVGVAIGAILAN